jgi:glycosyltransferase involved in cell wall biosynthesis
MPSVFFISAMNGDAWGGSEQLWYKTALHALEKNWQVSCAVYNWPAKEEKLQTLEQYGAVVYRLPNKGVEKKNLVQKIQFKLTKKILVKNAILSLPFEKHDITVVNFGEFENTHKVWSKVYKKLGQFILLFHNYKEGQTLKPGKVRIMRSWLSNSQLNLFASRRIIEVLEENSGISVTNADVLLNPISFPVPSQFTPYPSLQNGNYCFVMLAALEAWRKAQDNLIMTLSSEKWKQRNWVLHFYGEGKDKQKLRDLIWDNGLEQKIFLKGHTNDVRSVLRNSHLLLQMTHIDAMPLAVVEAMAVGRPVAVSKIGDMPYWINEEKTGWISEDASIEHIDHTLEKAWQQKQQWAQMGESAFILFKEKFSSSPEESLLKKIDTARKKN